MDRRTILHSFFANLWNRWSEDRFRRFSAIFFFFFLFPIDVTKKKNRIELKSWMKNSRSSDCCPFRTCWIRKSGKKERGEGKKKEKERKILRKGFKVFIEDRWSIGCCGSSAAAMPALHRSLTQFPAWNSAQCLAAPVDPGILNITGWERMKAESNNGYLKTSVIVEQNEISLGSGQETPATSPLQVRDLVTLLASNYVNLTLLFIIRFVFTLIFLNFVLSHLCTFCEDRVTMNVEEKEFKFNFKLNYSLDSKIRIISQTSFIYFIYES